MYNKYSRLTEIHRQQSLQRDSVRIELLAHMALLALICGISQQIYQSVVGSCEWGWDLVLVKP
jgi:hypothetical protein